MKEQIIMELQVMGDLIIAQASDGGWTLTDSERKAITFINKAIDELRKEINE